MPRNAGGVYTLPAGNPVSTGTVIQSTWANSTLSDVANEMTNSLDRAGRGSMTAPLKLADGTAAAPGLAFNTEPTSGLYRSAAGAIAFSVLTTLTAAITAGQFAVVPGTAALPSHSFIGDLNTGWSAAVADTLVGSTAGLNRIQVGPSGNVVVAVPTAGIPLSVGAGVAGAVSISYAGSIGEGADKTLSSSGTTIILAESATWQSISLRTAGSGRLSINSAGAVTIATPSAGSALTISGSTVLQLSSAAATQLAVNFNQSGQTGWTLYQPASSNDFRFNNGTDKLSISLSGTVTLSTLLIAPSGVYFDAATNSGSNAAGGASTFSIRSGGVDNRVIVGSAGNVTIGAPSSGDTLALTNAAGGRGLYVVGALSGGIVTTKSENTSNTANSDSRHIMTVGGTSAGDPYWVAEIPGGNSWCFGPDNSDSDTFKIDQSTALSTSTNRFNVTTDGRWYGNALHNSAGAVTGTTNQYIASGTYTPTMTAGANCAGAPSVSQPWLWTRVGNIVSVAGSYTANATVASTSTIAFASLPIASNLATADDLKGTNNILGPLGATEFSNGCEADTAGDRCTSRHFPPATTGRTLSVNFMYVVI